VDAIDAAEGDQAAALAKLEGYAARLALLHHVVSVTAAGSKALHPVGETSVDAAITLTGWFAGEATRVYTILIESAEERDRRRLVEFVAARGGSVSTRDLQRANSRRWPTRESAEEELAALVEAGLGGWEEVPAPRGGGHRQRLFRLHAPAPDTSDTRPKLPAPAPDTCSDTRLDGVDPRVCENDLNASESNGYSGQALRDEKRVSEVSGADAGSGEKLPDANVGRECRTEGDDEGDGHGDAWEGD
jgi:hypothetical protein